MHKSVLLDEVIKYLDLKEESVIVDCTLGYGGHSSEILKRIKRGFLFALDQDKEAIIYSDQRLGEIASNYEIINSNFIDIDDVLKDRDVFKVNGILFDLGVSSPQLDEANRGFSFHKDAILDMRMDRDNPLTAYRIVNEYSKEDLTLIFKKYGEEKFASKIADSIVKYRIDKPINTTLELVDIIKNSVSEKYRREKHPARKVFQALRIEVNDELNVLEKSLRKALDLIDVNGRILVITFHSLEDRICKNIFNEVSKVDKNISKLPIIPKEYMPRFKVIANVVPSKEEIDNNKRARSARLRVIERIW